MKTIFMPISSRQQARNILRTDIFKALSSNRNIRLVVFVPDFKLDEYKKEFQGDNLIIEGIKELPKFISLLDSFFGRLSLFYIDTPTGRFLRKQWLLFERKNVFRYLLSMFFLFLFGNLKFLRQMSRFLDYFLVKDKRFADFFEKYRPELVFLPNIISKIDHSFLRQAKKRKILTIGMINAWDNITLSKYPFRILSEKLVVFNEIIKKEAIKYLDMKEKNIFISGMPHFDHYVNSQRCTRGEFCKRLGIDPSKRIILFASIGSTLNPTEWQVLSFLDKAIQEKKLPDDIVIIFRQHPTEKTKMGNVETSEHIVIDDSKTIVSKEGRDYSEILKSDMDHLADSIFHSDVTINTCSTMSIDASVFDKPVINIAFDGWEKFPFHKSVARFYTKNHTHYLPVIKSGGVRIAHSFEELVSLIKLYLENPKLDSEGRKRIVDEQCWRLDGNSGKRIGGFILSLVK